MLLSWDRLSLVPERSPLWNARLYAGLTQSELAQLVGVTPQTISAVERGRTLPTLTLAVALARALQTSVEELFRSSGLDG